MGAALTVGMHAHFSHKGIIAPGRRVVKTLATVLSGRCGLHGKDGEIGGADLLEGSGLATDVRRRRFRDDGLALRMTRLRLFVMTLLP
jgi:hypothetical protein